MHTERRLSSSFSGRPAGALGLNPKPETRNPKEIRNPKSEKLPRIVECSVSDFGFSSFLRISDFGFRISRTHLFFLSTIICVLTAAVPARANPTQEDVFKSISSNVNDQVDGRKVIGFLAAFVGLVILMVLINSRQQRKEVPKVTNHQGRLMRELMRSAGLKRSQIRQLKSLSDDLADGNQPVENLVTLLLCPSLIRKARERNPRDR
jgi:hypothetical protein